jgi:hypothetical protein
VGRASNTIAAHPLTASMLATPAVATPSWVRSPTRGGSRGVTSGRSVPQVRGCALDSCGSRGLTAPGGGC